MRVTRQVALAMLVVAVASSGCKSQCRQLSEKLCDCTTNSNDRNTCLSAVANKEAANPSTAESEKVCEVLLPTCDCRLIDTTQGKIRCGLAYPLDGG